MPDTINTAFDIFTVHSVKRVPGDPKKGNSFTSTKSSNWDKNLYIIIFEFLTELHYVEAVNDTFLGSSA